MNAVDSRGKKYKWNRGWCECRNRPIRSLRQKRGDGDGKRGTSEGRE
jgi:hypothetical protein